MIASDGRTIIQINTQDAFDQACDHWLKQTRLAIDTEFVRTSTFYPHAGLFQLADDKDIYLVDPLAIEHWDSFLDILQNPEIEFILHSASEDLSLMLFFFGALPSKVFDTQIAAAYAGLGFSLSYQALVEQLLGIHVPKGETRSDWLRRPLTDKQLQYAASDVCYLFEIHDVLKELLRSKGAENWFREDTGLLTAVAEQQEDPQVWKRMYADISNAWRLSDSELKALQVLCYWRETESRSRDKPRSWIAKDADLLAIARAITSSNGQVKEGLAQIREISGGFKKRYADDLAALMNDPPDLGPIDRALLSPPLPPRFRGPLKAWKKIVQERAEALGIAPELLARKKWMHELLKGFENTGELNWQPPLEGWRQQELESAFDAAVEPVRGEQG